MTDPIGPEMHSRRVFNRFIINNLMPRVSPRMADALVDIASGKSTLSEAAHEHGLVHSDLNKRLCRLEELTEIQRQWNELMKAHPQCLI